MNRAGDEPLRFESELARYELLSSLVASRA
jgi:hypothetical protein